MNGRADSPPTQEEDARLQDRAALWAAFSCATGLQERLTAWLHVLAQRVPSAVAGGVYRRAEDGRGGTLVAQWGTFGSTTETSRSALQGLSRDVTLIRSVGSAFHLIAHPDGSRDWVIVFECAPSQPRELQRGLDEIRWGAGWLVASIEVAEGVASRVAARRLDVLSRAILACGTAKEVVSAADRLAESIVDSFPDTLVSVGVYRHELLTVAARRGAEPEAEPEDADMRREAVVRSALAQGRSIQTAELPDSTVTSRAVATDAEAVVRVCAVPLLGASGAAGVLLCERTRGEPFGAEEIETIEQLARLVAPIIESKPVSRAATVSRERRMLAGLFGPVRYKWKLAVVALLAAVLVLIGATGEYQARVRVAVEGAPPQSVTSAFDGRILDVRVRVGDAVRRGQVLARFDDTELQLERVKLDAERERLLPAIRDATDLQDRASIASLSERRAEIESRIQALDDRLSHLEVSSPVDGLVQSEVKLSGGRATVRNGDPLFTIAQTDGYRLSVVAADADQSLLREGQSGLARFGDDTTPVPFTITRISRDERSGQADVKVEAQAQRLGLDVSPGATGVGDIDFGTRKLVWIWWRKLQSDVRPGD
ncbi:MAG: HlyD family efflux transporter periplasmic adaptor subunit [Betaproteobacteria bacterium]|nr:HlyD family efflux transporter periplasmic adaptor subunit [Betaproteobacteria bacterium]